MENAKKRGRPPKNGIRDISAFLRSTVALEAYQRARAQGEKYVIAIQLAVAAVRERFPEMSISETEVKRVLREFQPEGASEVWVVTKSGREYSLGFGSRSA